MDNFEDKHIDDFFRDGSEQHAFPYKESSWDKMESLIEKDKKKRAIGFYITGFVVILAFIGSALYYSHIEKDLDINPQIQFAASEIIDNSEKNRSVVVATTEKALIETSDTSVEVKKSNNTIVTKTTIDDYKSNGQSKLENKNQDFISNTIEKTLATAKSESQVSDEQRINAVNTERQNVILNNKKEIQIKNIDLDKTFNQSIPLALQGIKLSSFERITPDLEQRAIPINKIKTSNSKITFGLVAGMEYSSVGFMSKSRGGYRLGAELSYQLKNKFEITSGVIVSQKKYITEAQNYSFSAGALMDNIMPMMVHGKCDVIEIPLEFSYYLKTYDKSSFYFSLGASTFLMRKEWYDFEYEKMYDDMDELPRSWADNGINNHLFGIGTIAVGYQKNINKNLAFQVEPYFQIPFTGIGTGQVNLVSGGLQFKVLFKK